MIKIILFLSRQLNRFSVFIAKRKLEKKIKKDMKDQEKAEQYRRFVKKVQDMNETKRLKIERENYLKNKKKK